MNKTPKSNKTGNIAWGLRTWGSDAQLSGLTSASASASHVSGGKLLILSLTHLQNG